MPNIDPTYDNSNSYKELFDMIDKKAKSIIKNDVWFQHRQTAKQAIAEGLIRKKTDKEIADELKSKPWLKVNKIIRKNEQQ
tara:strand:+ start:2601 stop:2843 length:243 start_codon:yes stop_codon:yes gene_type:complete